MPETSRGPRNSLVNEGIGAMNAAALAQFSPEEQCSEAPAACGASHLWRMSCGSSSKRLAMTTKTGGTELLELPQGPPLPLALTGATIQLSTLHYIWSRSSAGPCLRDPFLAFDSILMMLILFYRHL